MMILQDWTRQGAARPSGSAAAMGSNILRLVAGSRGLSADHHHLMVECDEPSMPAVRAVSHVELCRRLILVWNDPMFKNPFH